MQKSRLSPRQADFLVALSPPRRLLGGDRRAPGASAARGAGPGAGFGAAPEASRSEEWVSGRGCGAARALSRAGSAPAPSSAALADFAWVPTGCEDALRAGGSGERGANDRSVYCRRCQASARRDRGRAPGTSCS